MKAGRTRRSILKYENVRKIYSITVPGNVSHVRKHTVQKVREITNSNSHVLNSRDKMSINKKLYITSLKKSDKIICNNYPN
jgi:hypothetical protein